MPRTLNFLFALATLSATAAVAQSANGPANPDPSTYMQAQPAPIERNAAGNSAADRNADANNAGVAYLHNAYATNNNAYGNNGAAMVDNNDNQHARNRGVMTSQPIQGVWLRYAPGSSVQTVSANADGAEIRVEKGVADVIVQHPADNVQILVDLPGGQTSIVKDGTYTFNASTNTVRVLNGGEADAFTGSTTNSKGITIKSDQELALGSNARPAEAGPGEERADLLGGSSNNNGPHGDGYGNGYAEYAGGYGYPYAGYGYGYPYSYYGYGYPYGYGFGYGYPFGIGIGVGFGYYGGGYYGGFRGGYGGGYRGGYGGGFHGGGFHGR